MSYWEPGIMNSLQTVYANGHGEHILNCSELFGPAALYRRSLQSVAVSTC